MPKPITKARARFASWFFRNFFHAILIATAAAEWACIAWILYVAGGHTFPLGAHLLAVILLYAFNRSIVGHARHRTQGKWGALLRVYTAFAFVSLVCSVFLLASTALWALPYGLAGALSAKAVSVGAELEAGGGLTGAFRWFVSMGMGGIALTMVYGYVLGQHELEVTEHAIDLPQWGDRSGRLRIVQISDIHVGQNLDFAQLETFVGRVNALEPDLVCITGDIADSPRADYATFFPLLGRLRARFGVYAILGNHDHYAGAERVEAELRRWTDVRLLRDEGVTLDLDGAALHVIGLDDRGRDWARGVVSCGRLAGLIERAPRGVPILLLSHRPDVFPQAAEHGVALMLSGHTHGGQIAVPWFGGRRRNLAELITPFDRGLHRRGDCRLYVNRGLGVTGQRIRLFTPREITVFEIGSA